MKKLLLLITVAFAAFACNPDDKTVIDPPPATPEGVLVNEGESVSGGIVGVYVLNEGKWHNNNSTLDFYDYRTGRYVSDIFAAHNPGETFGLGDTGNDLEIYNGRLYAVMNASNLVIVMDAETTKYIGKATVANPRNIVFDGNFAYVSSYAMKDYTDELRKGHVAKIDLTTLKTVAMRTVGFQPDEMAIVDGKLYVVNSGGYNPDYDNTISVIDIDKFDDTATEIKTIATAPNLRSIHPDGKGNFYMLPWDSSAMYVVNIANETCTPNYTVSGSTLAQYNDKLYMLGTIYTQNSGEWVPSNSFATYDITSGKAEAGFITDGTDAKMASPYGLAIHPGTGEFLVSDAKDNTGNGVLSCYTVAGVRKWQVSTGVNPGHFAFVTAGN